MDLDQLTSSQPPEMESGAKPVAIPSTKKAPMLMPPNTQVPAGQLDDPEPEQPPAPMPIGPKPPDVIVLSVIPYRNKIKV
jgi:hypothetical protein